MDISRVCRRPKRLAVWRMPSSSMPQSRARSMRRLGQLGAMSKESSQFGACILAQTCKKGGGRSMKAIK